jgi:hypothetical protein
LRSLEGAGVRTHHVWERGTLLRKLLYTRVVRRLAALFVTVAALGAPKKW